MRIIRYHPPKASLWGHSVKKKNPLEFHSGVTNFLNYATKDKNTKNCLLNITLLSLDDEAIKFANALKDAIGISEAVWHMDEKEFDKSLEWYFINYKILSKSVYFQLSKTYEIYSWSFETGEPLKESSLLTESFGSLQYLGTRLTFHNLPEYYWVKSTASKTLDIEFNDKHLKPKIN